MTDAELVERARRGDRTAFGVLVERYQHVVFRTTLAVTTNRADAEDAAQNTFIRAFEHLDSFRGASSLKTWLVAIAWREAAGVRRALTTRLRRFTGPRDDEPFDVPAEAVSHERRVIASNEAQVVRRLVASLPRKFRVPLLLAASGDHTFEEMSEALGVPAGTLKWRVSEARRRLREKLRAIGYE